VGDPIICTISYHHIQLKTQLVVGAVRVASPTKGALEYNLWKIYKISNAVGYLLAHFYALQKMTIQMDWRQFAIFHLGS